MLNLYFLKLKRKFGSIFRNCSSILLQYSALKLNFLNFYFRVLNINIFKCLEFTDYCFEKYKLGNNFEDFVYKIFNLVKFKEINIQLLKRFFILINYSSNRIFYKNFIKEYIQNCDFQFNKLPNLFPFLVAPFIEVGDYRMADSLILILRKKKDSFFKRKVGLYSERSHLTAIGHLCLFSYYLKSREIKFMGNDNSSFIYNKLNISNNLFFELIKKKAIELGVKIEETNKEYNYLSVEDHEMELWPCKDKNKYFFAREMHGLIEKRWSEIHKSHNFYKVDPKIIAKANELLTRHKLLQSKKWFVGIHLRTSKDNRILRNASYKNVFHICKFIKSRGGEVVFTGTNNFMNLIGQKNIYFLNELEIGKSENELLQLYIWSKATFFIGNQSGGTHPPSLFGTPTIWIDVHPTVQARHPSNLDTIIPKRVFDLKNNKFLTFKESNSDLHFKCQTESEFLASISNYKVMPAEINSIEKVLEFYISKYVYKNGNLNNDIFDNNKFAAQKLGANYMI